MKRYFLAAVSAVFVMGAGVAVALPTEAHLCKNTAAKGTSKRASYSECVCVYRVMDATMDDDVLEIIFDGAVYGGGYQGVFLLPNPSRIEGQIRAFQRELKKNCKSAAATMGLD
ncbi:hypothetical protein HA397_24430 [Escherichia coli]|nr:hypothetical protein [Escherichia coli]